METQTPKVSVIIPVYNPGDGINKCIASVCDQTLREIEIIFVDDRGNDGSMKIVREAAKKDDRIRILTNEQNSGSGYSRNRGIEAARGEYLSFIDPDDYVNPEFLELLYQLAITKNLDIAKGQRAIEFEDGTVNYRNPATNDEIKKNLQKGMPLYNCFTYEHTTAIYKRKLLIDSHVRYGLSNKSQDSTFLLDVCLSAETIDFEKNAWYFYIQRKDSSIHRINKTILNDQFASIKEQIKILTEKSDNDENSAHYATRAIKRFLSLETYLSVYSDTEIHTEEYIKELFEIVDKLPYKEKMAENNISIRALLEYQINLNKDPFTLPGETPQPEQYFAIMDRWVLFFSKHPNLDEQYNKSFLNVIDSALEAIGLTRQNQELKEVYNSASYKVGNFLIQPLHLIKTLIQKLH